MILHLNRQILAGLALTASSYVLLGLGVWG